MENIEVLYSELEAKSKADQDLTESTSSFFKEKLSNVTEKNKNQILIYAVQKRTINIIRYFVRAEIKVTLPLKTETAIHIAIKCNSTEYFDLLFYVYGNVNYKTVNKKSKFSHFQAACMTSNVQRVQNFIDAGVDVNAGKPLLEAIERKNFEVIKFLLKSGANANVVDKRGRTPLQLIFSQFSDGTEYETNFELFRLLIKAKSDVNKTDKNGNSPMFYLLDRDLCIDNKKKTLEILLQNGADVTHVNKFGYSIMHYVFGCKNRKERDTFELIELFLKHGAHVNATDKWGLTPLHLICSQLSNIKDHGHEFAINTIKLLFINGANINTVNRFGRTPINCLWSQLSNIKNHGDEFVIHIIELLLSNGVDINTAVDSSGRTPINSLCSKLGRDSKNDSNLKLLQVLIKYKSDVNRKDKEGHHTLFNLFGESCGSSLQWDALKILLQNGANVTYINSAGDTILHHLIKLKYENEKHFIDIYELLLSNGADVEAVDSFGRTPINSLCCKCSKDSKCDSYLKLFQVLIKYKSDVNRKDKEGNSPMFNLFKRGWMNYAQKDALDILIQSGADVTHTNDTDDSVLHHLIYTDYKNQEYAMDIIELLLSNGADVDAVDTFGRTPVNLLCGKLSDSNKKQKDFDLKLLQFLIKYKCDVNRKDKQGTSPIFNLFKSIGINCAQKDALEILIYYGRVDIEHVDKNGDFILHRVINSINNNKKCAIDVTELLRSNGADVNAVDTFGRTPINLLCYYLRKGHNCDLYSKIFQLLIEHKCDINKNDKNGNSPIFNLFDKSWISTFQWNALQLFLKNGANVRHINDAEDSILHHIINSNENEKKKSKAKKISVDVVVELLLNNGADVNAVDTFGRTPINLLCYQLNRSSRYDPDLKILQHLIEHKSDVNRKDKQGNNPMFNLFNKSDYWGIDPLQWDALKILLNNGANVMQVNNAGHTIAHYTDPRRFTSTLHRHEKPNIDSYGIEYCVILLQLINSFNLQKNRHLGNGVEERLYISQHI
uniref:Uncharacterized protein n=1 Tax=Trichogramma kaykai TaxID=54128 RepID=A0ABD2XNX2_9HYME